MTGFHATNWYLGHDDPNKYWRFASYAAIPTVSLTAGVIGVRDIIDSNQPLPKPQLQVAKRSGVSGEKHIRDNFPSHRFSHLHLFAVNANISQQLRCTSKFSKSLCWPSGYGISRITLGI
jgi:hypothetical protein